MHWIIGNLHVNLLAVVIAAAVHMVTGLVWFRPELFGKVWCELTGKDASPARQWLGAGVLGHLAIAFALAVFIGLALATTVVGGLSIAVLAWVGFVVPLEIGELIWEKIPFRLFLIRVGNHLVALGLAGVILAVWR
jgi:hypothetical protein